MERLLHLGPLVSLESLDEGDREALHEAVEAYRQIAPAEPAAAPTAPCEAQRLLAVIRGLCTRMYQRAHEPRHAREKAALANLIFEAIHELNRLGFTSCPPESLPYRRTTMDEHPDDFAIQDTEPDVRPVEDEELPADPDSQD
jgi:hypothetical protein